MGVLFIETNNQHSFKLPSKDTNLNNEKWQKCNQWCFLSLLKKMICDHNSNFYARMFHCYFILHSSTNSLNFSSVLRASVASSSTLGISLDPSIVMAFHFRAKGAVFFWYVSIRLWMDGFSSSKFPRSFSLAFMTESSTVTWSTVVGVPINCTKFAAWDESYGYPSIKNP